MANNEMSLFTYESNYPPTLGFNFNYVPVVDQSHQDQPIIGTPPLPSALPCPEIPLTAEAAECIDALHRVRLGMVLLLSVLPDSICHRMYPQQMETMLTHGTNILPPAITTSTLGWTIQMAPYRAHLIPRTTRLVLRTTHLALRTTHLMLCTTHLVLHTTHLVPLTTHLVPLTTHLVPLNPDLSGVMYETSEHSPAKVNPNLSGATYESSEHSLAEVDPNLSGVMYESSKPFASEFILDTSIFGPMNTKEVKEGTDQHVVAHTPAIHVIVDSSILMCNIPSTYLTEFLQLLKRHFYPQIMENS